MGGEPYCELCCPTNYTEDYYAQHPEKYSTHPPTFLIQTELDSGADSCAAKHYHNTMLAHGAHSELGIVPLDQQRCFSIGNPSDPVSKLLMRRIYVCLDTRAADPWCTVASCSVHKLTSSAYVSLFPRRTLSKGSAKIRTRRASITHKDLRARWSPSPDF